MGKARKKLRTRAVAAVSVVSALGLVVGCGGSDSGGTGGGKKDGKTTITMGLFGVMGFKETGLLDKYMKEHPDVVIKADVAGDEQTYYTALQTHLAAGSGLKDIQGIEIGRAKELSDTQKDKFVDLAGAAGTDHFLPWKQSQVTTDDKKVIGLGTDIGPMAVCYRKDLFEQAGLPTDREEVAKLWEGDWSKYVEAGKKFKKNSKDDKVAFMDSSSGLFNAMIYGNSQQFYDKQGKLIYETNPVVKDAWKLASEAATSDLTAKLRQFPAHLLEHRAADRPGPHGRPVHDHVRARLERLLLAVHRARHVQSDRARRAHPAERGIRARPVADHGGRSPRHAPPAGHVHRLRPSDRRRHHAGSGQGMTGPPPAGCRGPPPSRPAPPGLSRPAAHLEGLT